MKSEAENNGEKGNAIRNTPQSFSQSLELSGEYKGVGKIEPPHILTEQIYRNGARGLQQTCWRTPWVKTQQS